jgi:hypothetical protein
LTSDSLTPLEQHDQLQQELASRRSTVHFAHTGVATVWACIFAGASAKLFIDSLRAPIWAFLAAGVALGLFTHALRHYGFGRRALREELVRFEVYKELRRQLKLDDPAALLPG